MKISLENLGILKKADFEIGDLTIICGANNTGKTYATYALFGFLSFWHYEFSLNFLNKELIDELEKSSHVSLPIDNIEYIIELACKEYFKHIPKVFASKNGLFNNAVFNLSIPKFNLLKLENEIHTKYDKKEPKIVFVKKRNEKHLTITLMNNSYNKITDFILFNINKGVLYLLFDKVFPKPYIASIERTGAAIFYKELDFTRSRLLKHISDNEKDIDPIELINTIYQSGYALPVDMDVDFIRGLEKLEIQESEIAKNHPDIISSFENITGGKYEATQKGLYFLPEKSKVKLAMGESSSSVRSLLNLGFYLKHVLKPGDFLMIDEPELNLHPKNQRKLARLLAKLVNIGVKIYITTHSDYVLKEFNTLIMLNNSNDRKNQLIAKHKYEVNELLDEKKVKAYIAKKELIEIKGFKKKQRHFTFVPAKIDNFGIEISEFDDTINEMNELQDDILYGG